MSAASRGKRGKPTPAGGFVATSNRARTVSSAVAGREASRSQTPDDLGRANLASEPRRPEKQLGLVEGLAVPARAEEGLEPQETDTPPRL